VNLGFCISIYYVRQTENRRKAQRASTLFTMVSGSNDNNPPRILKLALTVLYTPLLSNAIILWIINTTLVEYNWECINCRADEDPSYAQQFLFYSVWSLWLTIGVFIPWAYFTPRTTNENKASSRGYIVSKIIFRVALPHVTTVMLTYLYYIATNPPKEFVNRDLCYYLGKAFLHKDKKNPKNIQRLIGQIDPGPSGMAFAQSGHDDDGRASEDRRSTGKQPNRQNKTPEEEVAFAGSEVKSYVTDVDRRTTSCHSAVQQMTWLTRTRARKVKTKV
jgi:hypothetical protein